MSVREYIGARYVPILMGDWDNTRTYEPLSVVMYQGNSYTSRQFVPAGIAITNTVYWAATGNYNAQVESYRQEVQNFDGRIDALEGYWDENGKLIAGRVVTDSIVNGAVTTAKLADDAVDAFKLAPASVDTRNYSDSSITTAKIANLQVTTEKIANGAITASKLDAAINKKFWNNKAAIAGSNMVVFGDSYTADNIANSLNAYWPKRVATALGTELFNFAIAGAGFGRVGQLISTQQTNCANTMTEDEADNTSVVICLAGCNDILNDIPVANINAGISNFINWASTFFAYADIYVIPYNWGFAKLTAATNALINNSMNSIMTYNQTRIHIIPYAWTWNLGIASRYQNEVHPNTSGYNQIAARILSAINGDEAAAFNTANVLNLQNASGLNSGYVQYFCREGAIFVNGYVRPTNAGAQNLTIYAANKLPAILTPNDSLFVLPLNDSTSHTYAGVINFKSDGGLRVDLNSSVGANDVCCFNGVFIPEVGVDWADYVNG